MNDNGDRSFGADFEIRDGLLVVKFARPTSRLILTPDIARLFASCLLLRAEQMEAPTFEKLNPHPYNHPRGRHEQNPS